MDPITLLKQIKTESVDDVPVLIAQAQRMGIPALIDQVFPVHGNWSGLSMGWVTAVWLAHILSEANHHLNHVQPWVASRLDVVSTCLSMLLPQVHVQGQAVEGQAVEGQAVEGQAVEEQPGGPVVRELDFTDDRLAIILERLAHDSDWEEFETLEQRGLLQVYDLNPQQVRIDTTTASSFVDVVEGSLFQQGYSKGPRRELPILKILQATLDPLSLPVVTAVLPGNTPDDVLYAPAVLKVREIYQRRGLMYVGDCKMGASSTRALIQKGGDYYLCPLSECQAPRFRLKGFLEQVRAGEIPLYLLHKDKDGYVHQRYLETDAVEEALKEDSRYDLSRQDLGATSGNDDLIGHAFEVLQTFDMTLEAPLSPNSLSPNSLSPNSLSPNSLSKRADKENSKGTSWNLRLPTLKPTPPPRAPTFSMLSIAAALSRKMQGLEAIQSPEPADVAMQCQGQQGERLLFEERWIVSRSHKMQQAQQKALTERLHKATSELGTLARIAMGGKRGSCVVPSLAQIRERAEGIVRKYQVADFLHIEYREHQQERSTRAYKSRPCQTTTILRVEMLITQNEEAIQDAMRLAGWRVFASNAPTPTDTTASETTASETTASETTASETTASETTASDTTGAPISGMSGASIARLIEIYRQQPRIERGFGRLKGHPLSLTPLCLQRDDHIKGMARLLTIALQMLCCMEYVCRENLKKEEEATIAGLYKGNPARRTANPTAEALLNAFVGIHSNTLALDGITHRHMSALSPLQKRIVRLLGLPCTLYGASAPNIEWPPP